MEAYRIENLTFAYPNRNVLALDNVSLTVKQGSFTVICGASGSGKTTLLRHLKPSAAPHGVKNGNIYFEGTPIDKLNRRDGAAKIGLVMQSPENQIVTDKVWHELAFGLESLGVKTPEIRLRIAETTNFFGIEPWFYKSVSELSGGQKQLLTLASVMTMQPNTLILDEPTSRLDPIAAGEFLSIVGKINRELGITVVLTEHRLEEVFPQADVAVIMECGKIKTAGTPSQVGDALDGQNHGMFMAMPVPMRVWASKKSGVCPITVRDGADWLALQEVKQQIKPDEKPPHNGGTAVKLENIWFRYEKNAPDVLKDLSFTGYYGEISAILGGNGTGKTTALSVMAGLHTAHRGKVSACETVFMLPQDPQTLFIGKTVEADLLDVCENVPEADLNGVVELCRLEGLLDSHPYDLSGGEQQRAALAKVLLLKPRILLLDEPTKGLDAEYKAVFAEILRKLAQNGVCIIMVSHDTDFCAEHTDRCMLFFDGSVVAENTPRGFFNGNSFYTTSANRMARKILPNAVTAGDIICAIGGMNPVSGAYSGLKQTVSAVPSNEKPSVPVKKRLPKRTVAAAVMILLTIPLTIFLGVSFLNDRQFYAISMLIVMQTMLPFALVFEGRKPQARELVIIAVMCAIAVAGRAAFFMLPQFKPVTALVIIAGVAFGGEVGFLVGAVTGLISNMFFGQGPWTPWQMFAFGIIGFLAGVLFRKGLLSRRPFPLSVFGGLASFFIYGGIMNPASVLMFHPEPTIEMFALGFLYGIPFDLVHAAATVVFLSLISKTMLEKLDRIKVKYGLVE